jgi:predicted RNase H-like nuclease (RuvC/YqgF family)
VSKEREAYVQKLRAKVDEWNAEMDRLAAKADQAEAEAKIDYHRRLEALRAKRREIEDKLAQLQQAGEGSWEDLKQGLENSWEILKKSFAKAKSDFEQGYREGRKE